jgi:hypothetical protein
VRYWVQGEDEDFAREERRAAIAGELPPAGISPGGNVVVSALIAGQVLLWVGLAVVVIEWLQR